MLILQWSIVGSKKAVEEVNLFVEEMEALSPRKMVDSRTVSDGIVPMQTFLGHIMPLLSNA